MDEFWKIALDGKNGPTLLQRRNNNDIDVYDCCEQDLATPNINPLKQTKVYVFPAMHNNYAEVALDLCALPKHSGALGPLGSDPWYGSALLASILLHDTEVGPLKRIHKHLQHFSNKHALRVLELGSGAVGIPAFAAVLAIMRHRFSHDNLLRVHDRFDDEVVATDNDPEVLHQLGLNARAASVRFEEMGKQESRSVPRILVHDLDWTKDQHCLDLIPIHLAIGSELVYTPATASGCFKIVQELLRCNRDILIVMVQIADRNGWRDTFLPLLTSIQVDIECTAVPLHIHEHATSYVELDGILDALADFEACLISNRTA